MRFVWVVVIACAVLLSTASQNAEAINIEIRDGTMRITDFYGDFEKWSEVAKLLQASGAAEAISGITGSQMRKMVREIIKTNTNIDKKELSQIIDYIGNIMRDNTGQLLSFLANYYYNNFSKTEIRVIRAFYETPTGKKIVELQPKFVGEYSDFVRGWIETLTPQIKEKIRKEILDEHGYRWG